MKGNVDQKINQAREILDTIGQENEKEGIKWTKFFMDRFDKKEWEKNQIKMDKLNKHRMTKRGYFEMVTGMINELFKEVDKPSRKWRLQAFTTKKGVVMQIWDTLGRVYQKAFTPCGIPKIDLKAIEIYLGQAEDTMYKEDKQTKSGIILPS